MRSPLRNIWFVWAALAGAVASLSRAQTPSFTLLPAGAEGAASIPHAISGDGSVAVGFRLPSAAPGTARSFSWTPTGGAIDTTYPGSIGTRPWGLSGDGAITVGSVRRQGELYAQGYRRTADGTYELLPTLAPYRSASALAVSADGSVAVGYSGDFYTGGFLDQACMWTSQGVRGLGYLLPGSVQSEAVAISADGQTVVGWSSAFGTDRHAFRWTEETGMVELPSLPGGRDPNGLFAAGVSRDGRFISGVSDNGTNVTLARWDGLVPQELGLLSGWGGITARGISGDGGTVVAQATGSPTSTLDRGVVWTAETGLLDLRTFLVRNGVVVPANLELEDCYAVSADGLAFAGRASLGTQEFGFVATIPSPAGVFIVGLGLAVGLGRRR